MKKVLKVICITFAVLVLVGSSCFLLVKNRQLNSSYQAATQQVTDLQAKLNAVGSFADVYTIKTAVKMGQEIKQEDLILQTVPTSSIPNNVITDQNKLIGNYYRIGLQPGVTLTHDFVSVEEYVGSVYERDIFLDSLPVGTQVGDYLDIRVVLPGGEEFVVFPHKRVNARYENATKMRFDEADLWLYTSMMVDNALYKDVGFKIYAIKYVDPGSHDKTVPYYPVRKEVVDIMNISKNLTEQQRNRMWNESLRNSIDTKLKFYTNPLNNDSSKISSGVQQEQSRYNQAESYYTSLVTSINTASESEDAVVTDIGMGLVDPNNPSSGYVDTVKEMNRNKDNESIGNLNGDSITDAPTVDGQTDVEGNGSVIKSQDYLDNLGDNLFDDETPIE